MKSKAPINFVPNGSYLSFVKETSSVKFDKSVAPWKTIQYHKAIYLCVCGAEKELCVNLVKRGKVRSCGCMMGKMKVSTSGTHGLSGHPLFKIWVDIKTRCYNEKSWPYKWYGGIGVRICQEWLDDFGSFFDWAIKNGWKKGMRIDKDIIPARFGIPALLYSPEYCSIVTHKENCNARKSNRKITYMGKTKNMTEWEGELFDGKEVIYNRLSKGWSEEEALSTPLRIRIKNK